MERCAYPWTRSLVQVFLPPGAHASPLALPPSSPSSSSPSPLRRPLPWLARAAACPLLYFRYLQALQDPQWINCDVRRFDMTVLGKFGVIMADPPWEIHQVCRVCNGGRGGRQKSGGRSLRVGVIGCEA